MQITINVNDADRAKLVEELRAALKLVDPCAIYPRFVELSVEATIAPGDIAIVNGKHKGTPYVGEAYRPEKPFDLRQRFHPPHFRLHPIQ